MTLLTIYKEPNPILRQKSIPVDIVDDSIRSLMNDMLETMYDAVGIGLAAPQVGVHKRIIVIDLLTEYPDKRDPYFLINPEITILENTDFIYQEGCLSIPEAYEKIIRPIKISVDYLDYDGKKQNLIADKLLSVCIQHEVDHLNGVLFIDHLPAFKRQRIIRKIRRSDTLS